MDFKDATIANGIPEDRVGNKGIEATFIGLDDPFSTALGERTGSGTRDEVVGANLSIIDEADGDGIGNEGTKLFHEIECESGSAIARLVVKAEIGIEPDPDKSCDEVFDEEGVEK